MSIKGEGSLSDLTKTKKAAVAVLNHARLATGGRPVSDMPHGFKRNPNDCVLARGMKDRCPSLRFYTDRVEGDFDDVSLVADAFGLTVYRKNGWYALNYEGPLKAWNQFIEAFDDGQFLSLVDTREFSQPGSLGFNKKGNFFHSKEAPVYEDTLEAVLVPA